MDIREKRKIDHIRETLYSYETYKDYFQDISLIPNSSSSYSLDEIDLKSRLCGKTISAPLLINAMTGGAKALEKYNEAFSLAAAKNGIAIAVGSQKAGLDKKRLKTTYSIVRKVNPKGVIFANLSALENLDSMKAAIEMIEGDGLQLHINHGQELTMTEGDRDFRNLLKNIENAVKNISVPIIVKEVGTGISKEAAENFAAIGVKYFDVGGYGGTNFPLLEERRKGKEESFLGSFGIPTPVSIMEVRSAFPQGVIIASGGIRCSSQIVKSLVLGGDFAGIAAYFLKVFEESGEEGLTERIAEIIVEIKKIFVILGFKNINDAHQGQYVLKNEVKEWKEQRNPLK